MRVGVEAGSTWTMTAPAKVFGGPYVVGGTEAEGRRYDVAPDGRRFLMIKTDASVQSTTHGIIVVQNWSEELKKRVPTK